MKTKKSLIIIICCLIVIIAIIVTSIIIVNNNNKKDTSMLYGTVIKNNNGLLKLNTVDGDEVDLLSNEDLSVGDFVVVKYYKVGKDTLTSVEVIADSKEMSTLINTTSVATTVITSTTTTSTIKKSTTTTKEPTTTTATTTKEITTTTKKSTTTTTTTTEIADKDAYIVSYLENTSSEVDLQTNESKLKSTIIKIIDFIFYDEEINGIKFSELKATTKSKVIYYALLIDNKINEKIPDYKEKLDEKYQDFKSELIADYLDTASLICQDNEKDCNTVKEDFGILKSKAGITWETIKSCLKYAYENSVSALKNWYEIWSGKNAN